MYFIWRSSQSLYSGGITTIGLLCHDLLQRIFAESLPDWNSMMPTQSDDEDGDRRRLHVQKKVELFPVGSALGIYFEGGPRSDGRKFASGLRVGSVSLYIYILEY